MLEGAAGSGVYWRYENWIRRQESRFRGVVGMTGPIAMMRRARHRATARRPDPRRRLDPDALALAGKRVAFVAEAEARDAAFEDDREFKRKVRTLAGNYQLFARMPALLSPFSNPIWFETVSHKIMRLAAPWLMLVLAAASLRAARSAAAAPRRGWSWSGAGSVLRRGGRGPRGGRLGGVARTFVVLNAAAVVGLARHLTGRQRVTW